MIAPKITDLPDLGTDEGSRNRFLAAVREVMQTREGRRGGALEKGVTFRDLVEVGLLAYGPGGFASMVGAGTPGPVGPPGIPGPPGDPYTPDYTPPPTPTNLRAASLFRGIFIEWDPPVYTQGHGNAYTKVYVAQYSGTGALPVFSGATFTGQAGGATSMYVHDAAMGAKLHVWASFVSEDAVESVAPAGGTNGYQITVGKVGNADLGELIIEAAQLANNAVTEVKIGPNSITAGKIAANAIAVGSAAIANGAIINAMIANAAIDDAKIASLSAAKITFGEMSGERISAGTLSAEKITFGTMSGERISVGTLGADRIAANTLWLSGSVAGGAFTGYAWPAFGTGFYLGPQGLLLGNPNTGRYFQVEAGGTVYAPGFTIIDGNATFSGSLSAATGTFAGSLSAASGTFTGNLSGASGTFSGTLTASNIVTTANLAQRAAIDPRFSQSSTLNSFVAGSTVLTVNNVASAVSDMLCICVDIDIVTAPHSIDFDGSYTSYDTSVAVKRNGVTIKTLTARKFSSVFAPGSAVLSHTFWDIPYGGTFDYTVVLTPAAGTGGVIGNRTLTVWVTKNTLSS